jgi:hypothetical protein
MLPAPMIVLLARSRQDDAARHPGPAVRVESVTIAGLAVNVPLVITDQLASNAVVALVGRGDPDVTADRTTPVPPKPWAL